MCGLVGFVKNPEEKLSEVEFALLRNLFIHNQRRGTDSTGIFMADIKNRKAVYVKDTSPANVFVVKNLNESFIEKNKVFERNYSICLGHCRRATRGVVDASRAHPFLGKIEKNGKRYVFVMIHNGTIRDYDLRDIGAEKKMKQSDTEALFRYYLKKLNEEVSLENENSVVPTVIAETMKQMSDDGGYAIVVYSSIDHNVYAFRNSIQPLYIYDMSQVSDKVTGLWYVSDPEIMKDAVCSLYGTVFNKQEASKILEFRPVKLPEHKIVRFTGNNLEEVLEYSPKSRVSYSTERGLFSGSYDWFGIGQEDKHGKRRQSERDYAGLSDIPFSYTPLIEESSFGGEEDTEDEKTLTERNEP